MIALARVFVALFVLMGFAATAQAGQHRHHHVLPSYPRQCTMLNPGDVCAYWGRETFRCDKSGGCTKPSYADGGTVLSPSCRIARSQGGPCGCVAEEKIFGTSAHVLNGLNLWMARTWLAFPRATPAPGMAAVWGTHHVEAVVAVNGNTVTTDGPYGRRNVSLAAVRIVDPHGGSRYVSRETSHHYGRGSYRVASVGQFVGTGYGSRE